MRADLVTWVVGRATRVAIIPGDPPRVNRRNRRGQMPRMKHPGTDPLRSSGRAARGEARDARGPCAAAYVARLALFRIRA